MSLSRTSMPETIAPSPQTSVKGTASPRTASVSTTIEQPVVKPPLISGWMA